MPAPDRLLRRDFLKQASCLAVAPALAGLSAAQESSRVTPAAESLPIVDTHQHLWDLAKFQLPWTKEVPELAKSFVMSDYLQAVQGLNVVKTVYMEVDVHPSQQMREAEYVIDLCQKKDNPMVAAVISGRPDSPEFADYVKPFKDSPYIKGLRQVLHVPETPQGHCLQPKFVDGIKLLGDLGLSFDLCMRSEELGDADKLVAQCPNTRFILDHCGNLSPQETDPAKRKVWKDGLTALAARPNVMCKISGIIASAKTDWKPEDLAPNIRETLETFGPDRVMFAGDWPVCTLRATFKQWVEALQTIVKDFPVENRRKLFHDNAVKFYGLKDK